MTAETVLAQTMNTANELPTRFQRMAIGSFKMQMALH